MKISVFRRLFNPATLLITMAALFAAVSGQSFDKIDRDRMKDILKMVKNQVKDNYYDTNYRGIDIDARFKQADERLGQVTSTSQALGVIAQVLLDFDDSHLFFIPPPTTLSVEYGWRMQAIGDKVYITEVKPGSDGDKKGLKRGDQIIAINKFQPARNDIWKMQYYYNSLSKRDVISLTVLKPGTETPSTLDVKSEMSKTSALVTLQDTQQLYGTYDEENSKHRFLNVGDVTIWKMPTFEFDPEQVGSLMGKIPAGNSLVLDLRGNGGGYAKTMERLVGYFLDKDVKIADLKGRKKMDPSIAKSRGKNAFAGKLVVLVDSESGSAAEIFARVIQLEGRGKVVGDVSAGAVMQSIQISQEMGDTSVIPFAISVTHADMIMSDGKSLEHTGVTPDELVLPSASDLAAHRDPTLARAVQMLGAVITPEAAGKFFVYSWKKSKSFI